MPDETNLLGERAYLTLPSHAALPGSDRLRVGLAWAGNPHHKNDANRSIAWEQFATLTELDGGDFFSLQVGPRAADCAGSEVVSLEAQLNDVAATAAVITAMPDWRWQLSRTDSPWYSQVKLYRQDAGKAGWPKTLDRVKQDLPKRLA